MKSFKLILLVLTLCLSACSLTGEKFVPQTTNESIALAAVSIKAFAKSADNAYKQHLISQADAQKAAKSLQEAKDALQAANATMDPQSKQTSLSSAQAALTVVATILESMQETP
jgi:hypothetical protein